MPARPPGLLRAVQALCVDDRPAKGSMPAFGSLLKLGST